jgi:hypothetical protein
MMPKEESVVDKAPTARASVGDKLRSRPESVFRSAESVGSGTCESDVLEDVDEWIGGPRKNRRS